MQKLSGKEIYFPISGQVCSRQKIKYLVADPASKTFHSMTARKNDFFARGMN